MSFKVGDKVRVTTSNHYKQKKGTIGIISLNDGTENYPWLVEFDSDTNFMATNQLEKVDAVTGKGKKEKPRPVKFLLKYDLDEDPIEEFETMAQVKERIDYLVQNERSLKRDSIIVYTIKKKQRVTLKTNISLHA